MSVHRYGDHHDSVKDHDPPRDLKICYRALKVTESKDEPHNQNELANHQNRYNCDIQKLDVHNVPLMDARLSCDHTQVRQPHKTFGYRSK